MSSEWSRGSCLSEQDLGLGCQTVAVAGVPVMSVQWHAPVLSCARIGYYLIQELMTSITLSCFAVQHAVSTTIMFTVCKCMPVAACYSILS